MNDLLSSILYTEEKSALQFKFEHIHGPLLRELFTEEEMMWVYSIATSNKYAGKIKQKKKIIEEFMLSKGFKRLASGTNRVVYAYLEDYSFLVKIAYTKVALMDSIREYKNMKYLQPYCCKIFDVHHTGVMATIERIQPIRTIAEFAQVCEDVFELVVDKIIGKYVMDDIGSLENFQNFGIRKGFGVCILDFPYLYKLDGNKLYCNARLDNGQICDGLIDYDATFDNLICTKCGKKYFASELKSDDLDDDNVLYIKGRLNNMEKGYIIRNGEYIKMGGNENGFIVRPNQTFYVPPTSRQLIEEDYSLPTRKNCLEEQDFIVQEITKEERVPDELRYKFNPNVGEEISPEELDEEDDNKEVSDMYYSQEDKKKLDSLYNCEEMNNVAIESYNKYRSKDDALTEAIEEFYNNDVEKSDSISDNDGPEKEYYKTVEAMNSFADSNLGKSMKEQIETEKNNQIIAEQDFQDMINLYMENNPDGVIEYKGDKKIDANKYILEQRMKLSMEGSGFQESDFSQFGIEEKDFEEPEFDADGNKIEEKDDDPEINKPVKQKIRHKPVDNDDMY